MALTAAEIDALERARATGARVVRFEGRTVEYRSLEEIDSILADAKEAAGTIRTRQIRVYSCKGF